LPSPSFVADHFATIAATAVGVLLIGVSVSTAAVRQYATKHDYRIVVNQEMLAQGMSNVASGIFQGIFVDGSLSRSPINDQAGAKSQLSNLFQAVLVILTLLLLAPLFSYLPDAVLAAIIIEAVIIGMIDVPEMKRLLVVNRTEFVIALAALLGVLTFGVLWGVFIGVGLSIIWLLKVSSRPSIAELGRKVGTDAFVDMIRDPDYQASLVHRDAGLAEVVILVTRSLLQG
jgi:MFS superfamily sulfate permease-like transporter